MVKFLCCTINHSRNFPFYTEEQASAYGKVGAKYGAKFGKKAAQSETGRATGRAALKAGTEVSISNQGI